MRFASEPAGGVPASAPAPDAPAARGAASLRAPPAASSAASRLRDRFRKFLADREKRLERASLARARHAPLPGASDGDSDSDSDVSPLASPRSPSGSGGRPRSSKPDAPPPRDPRAVFAKCALLVLAWFGLSTALALFNKQLFGKRKGGFPAPLLLTSLQFFMQWLLAHVFLTRVAPGMAPRRPMPWRVFFARVAPVGVFMGLDIGLSNVSLVYVTVSFYTLVKTSSILFLLAFAFAFRVEPFSRRVVFAVATLALGEVLVVRGERRFDASGFVLCLLAAACSGLRWVLSQTVLHAGKKTRRATVEVVNDGGNASGNDGAFRSPWCLFFLAEDDPSTRLRRSHGMHSPPAILRAMMPAMASVVFAFSCFKERWWVTLPGSRWDPTDPIDLATDVGVALVGASVALLMSASEFELVKETSAVTVSVIGAAKDAVTVLASVVVFGDDFGVENVFGLAFVVAGVFAYNWHKRESEREATLSAARERAAFDEEKTGGGATRGGVVVGERGGGGVEGSREGVRDGIELVEKNPNSHRWSATASREAEAGAALAADLGVGPAAASGRRVFAVTSRTDRSAVPLLPRKTEGGE
jgi:solute carrier family 35 protein C2